MGKPKKGKKGKQEADFDDENDVIDDISNLKVKDQYENIQATKKNTTKKKKKAGFEALLDEEEEEDESNVISGFQYLNIQDAKEVSSDNDSDADSKHSDTIQQINKQPTNKQKKNKKKQKNKQDEDDDLDAILAEIDAPTEKESKKNKKKNKAVMEQEILDDVENTDKAAKVMTPEDLEQEYEEMEKAKRKKKKGGESKAVEDDTGDKDEVIDEEDGSTVKTAAQKRKEKKEREKKKKEQQKQQGSKKAEVKADEVVPEATPVTEQKDEPTEVEAADNVGAAVDMDDQDVENVEESEEKGDKKKSKKDKKKSKKEEKEDKKKKPANKQIKAMQEALAQLKEEEERLKREEEEKERQHEEMLRQKEEQKCLDEERKLKKKQKEKERKERLKKEGKLLTDKQKADRQRALQMLEIMKAQGIEVPQAGEEVKKKRPLYTKKKKQANRQGSTEEVESDITPVTTPIVEDKPLLPEPEEKSAEPVNEVDDDVDDAWDASDDENEDKVAKSKEKPESVTIEVKEASQKASPEEEVESSDEEDDSSDEESESESESSEDEDLTNIEKAKLKIQKHHAVCEAKRNTDVLRAPVVCVLGHVDTGKTKILDKLRRTNVQDGEAGGITQQIGATNVPGTAIVEATRMCKDFAKREFKLPGLLIIDTPGHESFSNLRTRGSSLCDIAILVVDIMHGLEPQTLESIQLLRDRKTPFVVALNKVDRLFQWKSNPHNDIANTLKKQARNTKDEFDERTSEVVVQFAEQGLNACLFSENKNQREYVSMVPTSAHTGDGMGNLLALICELTQTMLAKRISYTEELQATVMEVKALPGLGTTIDVILVNGVIHESDTIVIAGTDGPIVTQIRGLLLTQPMKELRVKSQYEHMKVVQAAQGCKIIAKDLDKALAGLPLYVSDGPQAIETEFYKDEISKALEDVLGSINLSDRGVFVQASTLGSLEALLEFLRTSKIPYAGINIGPIHKKDIMKASIMLEHDTQWAVILAFDVKVDRDAQELADSLGVKIFTADIIYHLFDAFIAYRDDLKAKKQNEFRHIAVFPCKLRILPECIFKSRDPIVCGVTVEAGFVKDGTLLCVPSKDKLDIGRVASIEINHKVVPVARQGQEVCLKIEAIPGEAPKLYGRHFDHNDLLYSKISRDSIDAVKNYFREEMSKSDWQLIMEMKKIFEIL